MTQGPGCDLDEPITAISVSDKLRIVDSFNSGSDTDMWRRAFWSTRKCSSPFSQVGNYQHHLIQTKNDWFTHILFKK